MDKRPLAVISVFFIIGIVLGRFLPDSVRLFHVFVITLISITLTLILSHSASLLRRLTEWERRRWKIAAHIFLFLSIISLGSLLYLNSNIFLPNHISHFLEKDKVKAEIIGVIKSPAERRDVYYGKVNSRYVFEIEAISDLFDSVSRLSATRGVSGLALIRIETEKDYQYGDRLMVKGAIKRPLTSLEGVAAERLRQNRSAPFRALLHSDFNYREYLENQNIFAIINTSEKNVTLLAHNYKSNPALRFAYSIREKLKNRFLEKMPLESGAFLRAILLGDRSELPKELNESFRNSGTMHILAISGLNVALLAGAFLFLFKLLRLKREIYYILTILSLIFLMALTGLSASVVRATIMCIIFLIGRLLGKAIDAYNSLGAAAFIILAINPKDIFNVGFQLSFIAVLSMVYFGPKLMKWVKKDWNFYVRKYLLEPFAVSVSATLGTFPLILFYFKMGTPIAVISNILIVPLMFILMIGGMSFIAFGWLPYLGIALSYFNDTLANIIFFLTGFFAKVKFGHFNI